MWQHLHRNNVARYVQCALCKCVRVCVCACVRAGVRVCGCGCVLWVRFTGMRECERVSLN